MIHWGFLILAFATGIGVCYGFLYLLYAIYKSCGEFLDWLYKKK